jgi:parvulin-like peptidyl-prolyl isomerase
MEIAIQKFIPPLRQRFTMPQAKEHLLRSMVNNQLFYRAAKDEDLSNIHEVKKKIDGAVEKTLVQVYRDRIEGLPISEKDMMTYYKKNSAKFKIPEQVRGRRILVETRDEAQEIIGQLKTGADFATLAKERSKDPTAAKGGAFGWLGRKRMFRPMSQVAFALEKGEVSGAIKTRRGYFIIKVEDLRGPGVRPFSEVQDIIRQNLEGKAKKAQIQKKTEELEEKYHVKLNLEFLSEVKVPVSEGAGQQDIVRMLQNLLEEPY